MKLDVRKPIIVFAGAWNPAIFQSGWIAHHLLGVPEKHQIQVMEVIVAGRLDVAPIHYFDDRNIGIFANSQRVEIFANEFDEPTIQLVERIGINLIQMLPHTPLGPFGINFSLIHENPDDKLLDIMRTRDMIEQHFKIVAQNLTTSLEVSPEIVLNFSRQPRAQVINFDFNFHHNQITATTVEKLLHGTISKHFEYSQNVLKILYGLEGYEVLKQNLTLPKPTTGAI